MGKPQKYFAKRKKPDEKDNYVIPLTQNAQKRQIYWVSKPLSSCLSLGMGVRTNHKWSQGRFWGRRKCSKTGLW